jgi:hypothetical protein
MAYWANALGSGAASKTTFIHNLLALPEYKQRVETMFKQVYFENVGIEDFDSNFHAFSTANSEVEITYEDIQKFVRTSQAYKNRISQQITETLHSKGLEAEPQLVESYARKFGETIDYTVENMVAEIKSSSAPTYASLAINLDYLKLMENAFGRALFVEEYFKYLHSDSTPQELFSKHTASYKATQRVYYDYCNVMLSEWDYIKKYIDLVDVPKFEDTLIEEVIQSKTYEEAMKNVLKEWYMSLFDVSLDAEDLHYIFEKVQAQRLHLTNDGIVKILKSVKAETDTYIEQIFPVYQKVLARQPDMQEISSHLPKYRSGSHVSLENDLIMSLEFHDILKTKIKTQLGNVPPSKLYTVLKTITSHFTSLTTMEDVDQFVATT